MKKVFTLCVILLVPLLMSAQTEFQVFHDTDQEDVFLTSEISSLVLKDQSLTVNRIGSESVSFAFNAIDSVWLDEPGPVLSDVTAGTLAPGDDVLATSNKDGKIYLVPQATNKAIADFDAAVSASTGVEATVTAGTPASLSTTGLADGNYLVYAVDGNGKISDASASIVLLTVGVSPDIMKEVSVYPNPVDDVLHVANAERFSEVVISSITGQKLIVINNNEPALQINTRNLKQGVYFIVLSEGDQTTTYKFIKK